MATVIQYNNLASLGKYILYFLGGLICLVATVAYKGTTFIDTTTNSINKLTDAVTDLKVDSKETKKDVSELKSVQASMQGDIKVLMEQRQPRTQATRTYRPIWRTIYRNPVTKIETFAKPSSTSIP